MRQSIVEFPEERAPRPDRGGGFGTRRAASLLALAWLCASGVLAQVITEYPIPTANADATGITVGPDGNLWFTETTANQIGRITPAGVITEFSVGLTADSEPLFIVAGPDGNLWFTEAAANKIGRITTAGVITEFDIPTANSVPVHITVGPDGNLWYTEFAANRIGRVTTAGAFTEFLIPTAGSGPDDIAAGPDGNLWFVEELGNKVGRISTGGAITEFPIPTAGSEPGGITAGPDGNLWFAEVDQTGPPEPDAGKIGRITPAGVITEFPLPQPSPPISFDATPLHIEAGPDGNLWFPVEKANKIGRISTSGSAVEYDVPTPGAEPFDITAGPDGAMWFTERNKIGRITTSTETSGFFTVTPCRVLDTRGPNGPLGGPALAAGAERTFVLTGTCAIPATAKSVSLNATVTLPTVQGDIRIHPTGTSLPLVSMLNFRAGQTRANNAIAPLGPDGGIDVFVGGAPGTVHFIIDVNGYFE